MGDQRAPRRKQRRRGPLPPQAEAPPHVMWPTGDSGYEASVWSPAGTVQQHSRMVARLSEGDRRRVRLLLLVPLTAFLVYVVSTLLVGG